MKKILLCYLLPAICYLLPSTVAGQSYNLLQGDTLRLDACEAAGAVIYDDGGPTGNYSNNFDGWLVVTASQGATITLSGDYTLESGCDHITLWDGTPQQGTQLLGGLSGQGTLNLSATSGRLTMRFTSDGSESYSGFAFTIGVSGIEGTCSSYAQGLTVTNITSSTASLSWTTSAASSASCALRLDNHATDYALTGNSYGLVGLQPNMRHEVTVYPAGVRSPCCASTARFRTACGTMELPLAEDFDDLTNGTMPPCWIRYTNFDDEETRPQVMEKTLMLSCGSNATGDHVGMVIGPKIDDGETWHVHCKLRSSHWGTCVVLGVCDSTTEEYGGYGFVPMETRYLYNEGQWEDYDATWTLPAGACRLAFRMVRDDQGGDLRMTYIDDVRVEKCGITAVTNYRTDSTSTMIDFTSFESPQVTLGIRPAGWVYDSVTIDNVSSPLTVTGLRPDHWYTLTLYTHCGSEWGVSHEVSVHTPRGAQQVTHYCVNTRSTEGVTFIGTEEMYANSNGIHARHTRGDRAFIISEELTGLGGKELLTALYGYYCDMDLGILRYRDDTTSFIPLAHGYTDYFRRVYLKTVIPDTIETGFLAVRFNSEINLLRLEAGNALIDSLRVTHERGTSVTLRWKQEAIDGPVVVEYGPEGFEMGTGTTVTFMGQRRGTISGLQNWRHYDFIVSRPATGVACDGSRLTAYTKEYDYPMPFCETFEETGWREDGWRATDGVMSYPRIESEYMMFHNNRSLRLASIGYDGWWLSGVELPDVIIDTGAILSFHATNYAPDGRLILGYHEDNGYDFTTIDTLHLLDDGERHHYHYVIPMNDSVLDHRLMLRYHHTAEGSAYTCFIDELQIARSSYDGWQQIFEDYDTAAVSFGSVGLWGTATMSLGGDAHQVGSRHWLIESGDSVTVGIGGLDTNSYLYCHVKSTAEGCHSLAGVVRTYGLSGEGCTDFGDLLSYELPAGWFFRGGAYALYGDLIFDSLAVMPKEMVWNGLHPFLTAIADTLFVGYMTDTTLLSSLVITDTLTGKYRPQSNDYLIDTIFTFAGIPDSAHISLLAHGNCQLENIGFSSCPIVDLHQEGGTVVSELREWGAGSGEPIAEIVDYTLYVVDNNTNLHQSYHVTEMPYQLTGLIPGHTYIISYQCPGGSTDCMPPKTITLTDSIYLPYCESFEVDAGVSGVPEFWNFIYADGYTLPHIDYGWSETPLVFGGWNWDGSWDYVVLPPVSTQYSGETMTVKVRAHIWNDREFEIGTVQSTEVGGQSVVDTASFVPLGHWNHIEGWQEMAVSLDSLGSRRIAMRIRYGELYLDRISITRMPNVKISLVDSRTLELTVPTTSSQVSVAPHYYVRYRNDYGFDTLLTVDTTVYHIQTEEWINDIYVTPVPDTTGYFCGGENPRWQLGERMTLPFCKSDGWWDWWIRRYCSRNCPQETNYDGNSVFGFHTNGWSDLREYMLLPDMDADSVQQLSMAFRMRSESFNDLLEVGVMWDAYDTNTFVPVDSIVYDNDALEWVDCRVNFSRYHGRGRWIAFRHRGGYCSNCNEYDSYLMIDDICVTDCPAAVATATLSRYNIVEVASPTLPTGQTSSEPLFYAEYGSRSFSQGSGTTVPIYSNPTMLTLAPERDYDFYFRCDSLGYSCQTAQKIHTLASPLVPPVCISFDDVATGSLPTSWQQTVTGQQSSVTNAQSHSAGNALLVGERIVTPDIFVDSLQEVAMGLWVMAQDPGDRLLVGVMNNPVEPLSFTRIITIVPEHIGVWEHHNISFQSAPTGAHFIALRHTNASTSTLENTLFVDDVSLSLCSAFDLKVEKMEEGEITLTWNQVGEPTITVAVIEDGTTPTDTYTPTAPPLVISPVTSQHSYTFLFSALCSSGNTSCDMPTYDTVTVIAPRPGTGCVNPTDLTSASSVFFSGTYNNPYSREGVIDYGSLSPDSRHTVCYDTTARDPRTGGQLRMVPLGATSSVRLGNWTTNFFRPEAEGVIYSLFVDTLSFNLLILRYAAVLQDPMHASSDQPRFRLELLDSSFTPIANECASADFIANRSLGWNEAEDNVLWKDWTTYGIDMSEYADQQVYVRLTTYDCNEGSHYGYAYFTLECMRSNVSSESCGAIAENTFTAPAGFNYRWYSEDNPNVTLGTEQTLSSPAANTTYLCDLSSPENVNCAFTISTYAGTRYPMARFDTMVSYENCGFTVQFNNRSTVSSDGINPVSTGEACESAYWDFGNGETSTNYHGQTFYDAPGTYTVTLVSGIAGGECKDTTVLVMNLAFPANNPRIEGASDLCLGEGDTLRLYDAVTTHSDWITGDGFQYLPITPATTTNYQVTAVDPYGCSWNLDKTVTVHPLFHQIDTIILCSPLLPYSYADTLFDIGTTDVEYHLNLLSAAGCDSSYHLWLTVNDAGLNAHYDTVQASICDNESYSFFGGSYSQEGTHVQVHLNDDGLCDSIHSLILTVRPTSVSDTFAFACDNFVWHQTSYPRDTLATYVDTNRYLCDSTISLHLTVHYSNDTVIHHSVVENNLPYLWNGISFSTDTLHYPYTTLNSQDCDSSIDFSLTVYRNQSTTDSRSLCEGMLPIRWNGVTFMLSEMDSTTSIITHTATLATSHGADSVVTMYLTVLHNTSITLADTVRQNGLGSYTPPIAVTPAYSQDESDPPLVSLIDTTLVVPNAAGCDSIIHYTLHLWRNHNVTDSLFRCASDLPVNWQENILTGDTLLTQTLTSLHGTDSVVTVVLTVYPIYDVNDTILICPHQPYLYEGVDYGGPIQFDSPHLSVEGCDSLVHVTLLPRDTNFKLEPIVSLEESQWYHYDTTLLGCEPTTLHFRDTSLSVSRTWALWSSDGQGDTVSGSDSLFTTHLDTAGIYSFQLVAISAEGCYDTVGRDSLLWVFHNPQANFIHEPGYLSIHHPEAQFYNTSTLPDTCYPLPTTSYQPPATISYLWFFPLDPGAGSCDTSNEVNPGYRWEMPTTPGEYPVQLVASLTHYLLLPTKDTLTVTCTDTATVAVNIVNTYLQFPNSVTPNGDGTNDIWKVVNLLEMGEYSMNELWIYDRWGDLVYHAKNIRHENDFWDPNETNSPDGTYYFRFSAMNTFGVVKHNGVIEVSR